MNSETTTMMMDSETLTTGVLAVIKTVPSVFVVMILVALTATTIVLVHKRRTKQGTQAEAYYGTEEDVANSLHTEFVDTTENVAYGTNIIIAPEIQVEENMAYGCKPNASGSALDAQSSNEDDTYYY